MRKAKMVVAMKAREMAKRAGKGKGPAALKRKAAHEADAKLVYQTGFDAGFNAGCEHCGMPELAVR